MAIDFVPTLSKRFFVGRDREMQDFENALDDTIRHWIIHVPGEGGVGKTRLLEEFRARAQSLPHLLITRDLIDFYNAAYQTAFGLLQEITRQLGTEHFSAFVQEREAFNRILSPDLDPDQRQEGVTRVTDAFFADFAALLKEDYRIILLFDTCEEMHAVESFVLDKLLPGIRATQEQLAEEPAVDPPPPFRSQTTVVLAGRKSLDLLHVPADDVLLMALPALTLPETSAFFRNGGMNDGVIADADLDQVYLRTGGRPLYVALSFDWISNQVGTVAELLSLQEPFGQTLVEWLVRVDTPERRALLYTALAWRRMEPDLLARLLNLENEQAARRLIDDLQRFSFVKYYPAHDDFRGRFQLHDEVRDLVNKYVWRREGEFTQERLLQLVVEWYEERIDDPTVLQGETLPPSDEARSLVAEWFYYRCRLNLHEALARLNPIFRRASHFLDLAFCDLLIQETRRFLDDLRPGEKDEVDFREGLVAFRREQYSAASGIWHALLRRRSLDPHYRANTLMQLVELEAYTGRADEALEHAQDAEGIYQTLLASAGGPAERQALQWELGQLYNNWGFTYRVKGSYPRALEFYERALTYGGSQKNLARTQNNIGYVYLLQAKPAEGKTWVGRALQLRRKLKIPYELGLGLNTMGMIMERVDRVKEAMDLYQSAVKVFQAAPSERGEALALLNLGRMRRITNEYEAAEQLLTRARRVFQDKKDTSNLTQAYNELGCVYRDRARQRGQDTDWTESERYLLTGLELSRTASNTPRIVESLEDLGLLHYNWAEHLHKQLHGPEAREHQTLALTYARQVEAMVRPNEMLYRWGKNEKLLGDLAYLDEQWENAFEHYFEACRLMKRAPAEQNRPTKWTERKYDEMVDRLQEQLNGLPGMEDTRYFTNKMLTRLRTLSSAEQDELQSVRDYLDLLLQIVDKNPT